MLHTPSRNFVVVAHPRTGTNFLCHMIANRQDVRYLGEFYPDQKEGQYNIIDELFNGNPNMNLRWRYDIPDHGQYNGRFAKLFYYLFVWPVGDDQHVTRWDLLEYMKREGVGIIHLKRRNALDTALSYIRSTKEKNYIYRPYDGALEIPAKEMAHHLWLVDWQTRAMDAALQATKMRHLEVWYDEMTADPQKTADRAADFLHRPRRDVVIAKVTQKQRKGGQRENILNYDELKEHFSKTPYGVYFED